MAFLFAHFIGEQPDGEQVYFLSVRMAFIG